MLVLGGSGSQLLEEAESDMAGRSLRDGNIQVMTQLWWIAQAVRIRIAKAPIIDQSIVDDAIDQRQRWLRHNCH